MNAWINFLPLMLGQALEDLPAGELRPPKGLIQVEQARADPSPWLWVGIAVSFLLVLLLVWWLWRRGQRPAAAAPELSAAERLTHLKESASSRQDSSFVDELSDLLRLRVEEVLGLSARHQTSAELLIRLETLASMTPIAPAAEERTTEPAAEGEGKLRQSDVLLNQRESLVDLLQRCDAVKFAGASLLANERSDLLRRTDLLISSSTQTQSNSA